MEVSPPGCSVHGDSPKKEYWSELPQPPAGDFPNPGMEPRSSALKADSLPTEPPGKPKNTGVGSISLILQGISQPRNWTGVSCIAGRLLTSWAIREALPVPFAPLIFTVCHYLRFSCSSTLCIICLSPWLSYSLSRLSKNSLLLKPVVKLKNISFHVSSIISIT